MTTLDKIKAEIQKVLDAEGDSESAKAQALALFWVLELIDKYAEQEPCDAIHGSTYGGVSWGGTYKPQEQTGHWIYTEYHTWCCSECGGNPHKGTGFVPNNDGMKMRWKYCNLCGAKMVEPQESEEV